MIADCLFKANILINKAGQACVSDYGLAVIAKDGQGRTSNARSTMVLMAPELKTERAIPSRTYSSDVYAIGMIIWKVGAQ